MQKVGLARFGHMIITKAIHAIWMYLAMASSISDGSRESAADANPTWAYSNACLELAGLSRRKRFSASANSLDKRRSTASW
jgi:hypothetical protein